MGGSSAGLIWGPHEVAVFWILDLCWIICDGLGYLAVSVDSYLGQQTGRGARCGGAEGEDNMESTNFLCICLSLCLITKNLKSRGLPNPIQAPLLANSNIVPQREGDLRKYSS